MAITLSSPGLFVAGTTQLPQAGAIIVDTASAQTVTLPVGVEVGYRAYIERRGANNVTIAAGTGDTLVGDTATTANYDILMVVKSTSTEWTGALVT